MTGSSLAATSGVTIQGATVNKDGSFSPVSPDTLTPQEPGQPAIFRLSAQRLSALPDTN